MEKNVTVKWAGKMTFIGCSASGNMLTMDAGTDAGGLGCGHSPMDLLLMGAGGCASIDVVSMLQKGRNDIVDCAVKVTGKRASEIPKVYTDIHMHFTVTGSKVKESAVERAITLSLEKYCSASLMLAKAAKLTFGWEVVEV